MYIREIFIESFGAAQQMRVGELEPGLAVIIGSNEAGKSTVLEFVRSVFYGYKRKGGSVNIYEAPDGTPRKGRLTLCNSSGEVLRVERAEKRGSREGGLAAYDLAGNRLDSSNLMLRGMPLDRKSYEGLFAFDIEGMRRLDREALRGKILAAAFGSIAVNPIDVITTLTGRIRKIAKCPPREGESLWSLQDRLKELDKQLKAGSDAPDRHSRLIKELADVEARRGEIVDRIRSHEASLSKVNRLLRYEEESIRLAEVEREISSLEDARTFPAAGVDRLERALERAGEIERSVREATKSLEQLRSRRESLTPDTKLLEHSAELHSLGRDAGRLWEKPLHIEKGVVELARSDAVLEREMAALGPEWNRERLEAFEPSVVIEHEIRSFVDSWQACREEIRHAGTRLAESEERRRGLRAKTRRINSEILQLTPFRTTYLPREVQRRLEQWKSHRYRISDLKDNLEEKARRLQHLAGVRRRMKEALETAESEASGFVSPVLSGLAILVLSLAAAGLIYTGWTRTDLTSFLFLASGVGLSACIPLGIRWKVDLDRRHWDRIRREKESLALRATAVTHEIAQTENSRRVLRLRIEELQRESGKIAEEVLGDRNADRMDVLRAESASAKAEQPMQRLRSLEAEFRTASEDLDIEEDRWKDLARQVDEANERLRNLRDSWERYLADQGMSREISPESALGLLGMIADAKGKLQRHMARAAELEAMQREWDDFSRKVRAVAGRIGRSVNDGESLLDQVDQWVRSEIEAREVMSERDSLTERIIEHETVLETLQSRLDETRDRVAGLMNAAGVNDEEAFRDRSHRHDRLIELERVRSSLLAALQAGLGLNDEAELHGLMSSQNWSDNHSAAAELQAGLEELRTETEHLAGIKGKLAQEIESLESEDRREVLLAERQQVSARLDRLVEEWITIRIALTQMEKMLRIYETDKQPKVMEKASEIFRQITGNMYTRILFPLDEDQVKAERADQSRVEEHHLSRGTLEQVYLALRLAHLEILRAEDPVPVLMDDVLVNFDPLRARRTAEVLADF
ncbi:MAG: AAA family ATPase, partial [Pseudomonadota bacterium]